MTRRNALRYSPGLARSRPSYDPLFSLRPSYLRPSSPRCRRTHLGITPRILLLRRQHPHQPRHPASLLPLKPILPLQPSQQLGFRRLVHLARWNEDPRAFGLDGGGFLGFSRGGGRGGGSGLGHGADGEVAACGSRCSCYGRSNEGDHLAALMLQPWRTQA